ncbi:hypothetical protein, partial [Roseisolibacter sp. H3M3-2]|uniref:hypothetical protein n=1 Tax=Roseisolibacter sp. H3M3-2 TaxID=3031323 RepID=UPI0023D9B909
MRGALPDGVPQRVALGVVEDRAVGLHAARVEREAPRGAAVVVAVDRDVRPVGVDAAGVAARELRGDRVGAAVVQAEADVQRLPVEQHAHLGALGGRGARGRDGLDEVDGRRGVVPRALVEAAVDAALGARGGARDDAPPI